jgi:GNAT superfamily N-acetyltransferase
MRCGGCTPVASVRGVEPAVTIRTASAADIPAAAAVRASASEDTIITTEGMRTWLERAPAHAELLLLAAEVDGAVVAWCTAARNTYVAEPGLGMLDVTVLPEHQRRGIGTTLIKRGLAHLDGIGLHTVRSSSPDGPAQRAFAERFGYIEVNASSSSAVDPRTVQPLPVPEGVILRSFGEIDDPGPLYELDLEVSHDIPGEQGMDGMSLEQWKGQFWRTVLVDDDASLAAYVDGELAAVTFLRVDRPSGRAQNNLTGTRKAYRGRGLARLLKTHSLHRAARAGATIAFTDNDETNSAMLAVNRSLGYRHLSRHVEWERHMSTEDPLRPSRRVSGSR